MNQNIYKQLTNLALSNQDIDQSLCRNILTSKDVELLPLLNTAFTVRRHFVGMGVKIHIINNAQNGNCREDCHYCAQAKTSTTKIEDYPLKPDAEILAEAKNAYEKGAFRYCMVFAGRGPSMSRTEHLARLIQDIKSKYPIQICVSCGLLNGEKAKILKKAGLDRLNHNLNTSEKNYPKICTTHTYQDRLDTLQAGRDAGIQLCSGIIVGMKETHDDVIEVAQTLRTLKAESIPVNFFIPVPGSKMTKEILAHSVRQDEFAKTKSELTPEYCLRVLCLYRFLNPKAEIRIAAGREIHLRSMESMALYPANSLFLDGYLNTKGTSRAKTLQMIKDSGFTVESEYSLDELLENEQPSPEKEESAATRVILKDLQDLRPQVNSL